MEFVNSFRDPKILEYVNNKNHHLIPATLWISELSPLHDKGLSQHRDLASYYQPVIMIHFYFCSLPHIFINIL